ncbi:adenosylcobinamide-phosphate synthase CbiB [Salipaludibacillus daqingensis]|uniref:adenosylcobinamide-phosphate synthase CbiB n=1 Tax=Salipaludibacillus daqingensis TaxID=3041001 RepID=UPI00247370C3|nr:adenosylcobinamide-phosphate synthase CbiB [Salipaludibacillus daqingensis]
MIDFLIETRIWIITAAILLDIIIGDPKWLPHPVIGFGKLISFLDKKWNHGSARRKKNHGILTTTVVVGVVIIGSVSILGLFYHIHVLVGMLVEVYLISSTIAIKGLRQAALQVALPLSQGHLVEARYELSMIVGRDTQKLEEKDIVRGAVETVAENTVDGITAPLFWAFIGGAPLAMAYRSINTLDSMVGYKNERYSEFGWASAKLDDLVNWVPARITSLTFWLGSFFMKGSRWRKAWLVTMRDAKKHPSPNSGWSEAMVAALMGVQLGGRNEYKGIVSHRAEMGDPLQPLTCQHIYKSIGLMHGGWILFYLLFSFIWFVI